MRENAKMWKKNRGGIIKKDYEKNELVPLDSSSRLKRRIAVFAAVVLLGVFVFAGCRGGVWERFISFALGSGLKAEDRTETEEPPRESETVETEIVTEERVEVETSDGESSEKEPTETSNEESKLVAVDLSQSDKGSFYILDEFGDEVDVGNIADAELEGAKEHYSNSPVVLILHSHTSEKYADADGSVAVHAITKTVVAVGERIASRLNMSGVPTVHCTVIHDEATKAESYIKAADTVKTMLEIYPTIKYVIDLHRLSLLDDEGGYVKTLSRVGSAQIRMLVDSESGDVQALILAARIREKLNCNGAKIAMPVIYSGNLPLGDASPYFMKLEVGSYGNLTSEAVAAGELFADAFAAVVKGK
jgi:stage II sporulation protein P